MTTPAWTAPLNGFPANLNATNTAAGINQFLGAHATNAVYQGNAVVSSTAGFTNFTWQQLSNTQDFAQPFTLTGTTIGRVQVPLLVNGNGASVSVGLYADNGSGSPNIAAGAIATTIVPASYIQQVAASSGIPSAGPLATGWQNTMFATGGQTHTSWTGAAINASSTISNDAGFAYSNGFGVFVGGTDLTITSVSTVFSTQVAGITTSVPQPQPALPTTNHYSCPIMTSDTIVVCGGDKAASGVYTGENTVFAASWNSNTGVIGGWSVQASLPGNVSQAGGASWNNHIYVIGGSTAFGGTVLSSVYHSSVTNGQVAAWDTYNPLPAATAFPFVAVIGNWLVVAGGNNSSIHSVSNVYYAAINSDGTLGNWQNAPSLNTAVTSTSGGNPGALVADDTLIIFGGVINGAGSSTSPVIQALTFTPDGPGLRWNPFQTTAGFGGGEYSMVASSGFGGQWNVFDLSPSSNLYTVGTFTPVPLVSVPLYATGLTNAATYHLVFRQFASSSVADSLSIGTNNNTFSNMLSASRNSSTWSPVVGGYAIQIVVYDTSASGPVRHVWTDPDTLDLSNTTAQWSTMLYNNQGLLIGATETTLQPNNALNSNPTFTSGVSPWTATNGTITQSNVQTHGGFPFSGLLTPTGGFATSFASSELFPVKQPPWDSGQWVLATGFFYSPTGWSNFSLSVSWYDSSNTLLSTSSANLSLAANTWTQARNYFQPPSGTASARLVPTESGTPGATNLLYMSNVYLVLTPESIPSFMSAATVNYATGAFWPPIGVTQLN